MTVKKTVILLTILYVIVVISLLFYRNAGAVDTSLSDECNQCINVYCIVDCNSTSHNCGKCIEEWCSFEC